MLVFERIRMVLRRHPFLMIVLIEADLDENINDKYPATVYRR